MTPVLVDLSSRFCSDFIINASFRNRRCAQPLDSRKDVVGYCQTNLTSCWLPPNFYEHRPFFRTVSLLTLRGHFPSHIFKSLHRCLVANTGMPALSVVEDLDVFEDCSLGLSAGSEPLTVHQLLFQ